ELLGSVSRSLDLHFRRQLAYLRLDGARCTLLALGGAPVAGQFEERGDLLGGLCAPGEPVLRARRGDLDQRGLCGGVVLAALLDGPAVTLGARVHDHDAVVRVTLLAEALQTNFHSHAAVSPCIRCEPAWHRPGKSAVAAGKTNSVSRVEGRWRQRTS